VASALKGPVEVQQTGRCEGGFAALKESFRSGPRRNMDHVDAKESLELRNGVGPVELPDIDREGGRD